MKNALTLFDSLFNDFGIMGKESQYPKVNLSEEEKEYGIDLLAPGADRENFKVSAKDNMITIEANFDESKEEKGKNYHWREFKNSNFLKQYRLPPGVDEKEIKAKYKDGVLRVTIPKTEKKQISNLIQIE